MERTSARCVACVARAVRDACRWILRRRRDAAAAAVATYTAWGRVLATLAAVIARGRLAAVAAIATYTTWVLSALAAVIARVGRLTKARISYSSEEKNGF